MSIMQQTCFYDVKVHFKLENGYKPAVIKLPYQRKCTPISHNLKTTDK